MENSCRGKPAKAEYVHSESALYRVTAGESQQIENPLLKCPQGIKENDVYSKADDCNFQSHLLQHEPSVEKTKWFLRCEAMGYGGVLSTLQKYTPGVNSPTELHTE